MNASLERCESRGPGLGRVREVAEQLIADAPEGDGLDARTTALVAFAVASAPTTLDASGMKRHAQAALDAGATSAELTEAMVLASAIGVHGLHEGSRVLCELLSRDASSAPQLDEEAQELRDRLLGDPYWQRLDRELTGFVDSLLALSMPAFRAFVDYCAVPWQTGTLEARTKELIYISVDSTPTHRYLPGMRFHIANALALGATRREILDVIEIAAAAGPGHGIE